VVDVLGIINLIPRGYGLWPMGNYQAGESKKSLEGLEREREGWSIVLYLIFKLNI